MDSMDFTMVTYSNSPSTCAENIINSFRINLDLSKCIERAYLRKSRSSSMLLLSVRCGVAKVSACAVERLGVAAFEATSVNGESQENNRLVCKYKTVSCPSMPCINATDVYMHRISRLEVVFFV